MSGAGKTLETLFEQMQPEMKHMEEHAYPAISQLERTQRRLTTLKRTMTPAQRRQLDEHGYTLMNSMQQALVHGPKGVVASFENEAALEKAIRALASGEEILGMYWRARPCPI